MAVKNPTDPKVHVIEKRPNAAPMLVRVLIERIQGDLLVGVMWAKRPAKKDRYPMIVSRQYLGEDPEYDQSLLELSKAEKNEISRAALEAFREMEAEKNKSDEVA